MCWVLKVRSQDLYGCHGLGWKHTVIGNSNSAIDEWNRCSASTCKREFHFVKFHFVKFHFVKFHFVKLHFVKFHFVKFHFVKFHFVKFHFVKFHFVKFHFVKFHFVKFHSVQLTPESYDFWVLIWLTVH